MSRVWAGLLILILLVAPPSASAHVKWFADATRYPLRTDLIVSGSTALWLGASAVVLLWASLVRRVLGQSDWPRLRIWDHLAPGGPTQLAVLATIALVSAAVRPSLLAPNLSLPSGPLGVCLAGVELAIAASFVTGIGHLPIFGAMYLLLAPRARSVVRLAPRLYLGACKVSRLSSDTSRSGCATWTAPCGSIATSWV